MATVRKQMMKLKETSNEAIAEENHTQAVKNIDLDTGLMKLFWLDGRFSKKQECQLYGSSNLHLHVRPPAGVNYTV